jgi:hypothetical protein
VCTYSTLAIQRSGEIILAEEGLEIKSGENDGREKKMATTRIATAK